jgi:hypothetical protein
MAELASKYTTLIDLLKNRDPDGRIAKVIELLSKRNEILLDGMAMEANGKTHHRTTVRTGLPAGTWRKFYGGVQPTKSTEAQVDEIMGMLEATSQVDKDLAKLSGDLGTFRLSKSKGHMQGMNNDMATALFYSNADSTPEQFHGFSPRYSVISTDDTKSGYNIVDGGGAGADNTSIWLVTWGDEATHLIYPQGSMAGLQHDDMGEQIIQESDGSKYRAYLDWFKWDIGLVVQDHRANARIANIDVSLMAAGSVDLIDLMIDAWYKTMRGSTPDGMKVWYCNIAVHKALHKLAKNETNVNLTLENFEGKEIVSFLGSPVRICESIVIDEALVA